MPHSDLIMHRTSASVAMAILTLTLLSGCSSGDGNGPAGFGTVKGTVHLPFKFAAANEPVEGATVLITAGDFDTTATTDANGQFVVGSIPSGTAAVTATLGTCLAEHFPSVSVPANDTLRLTITLASDADFDTIPVPWAGAIRMELEPANNRAIMLIDAASTGGAPEVVVVDLSTGQAQSALQTGLTDVYDLAVVGPNLVVFNFLAPEGHCLRFFNPSTMEKVGNDVLYFPEQTVHPGKIALDDLRENVFVTHGVRLGTQVAGRVWAVNIAQRQMIDVDDDIFDLVFSFDTNLVAGSLGWSYGISFDAATQEILVASRQSKFITAIDWTMWGDFDREANLSIPTTGVRRIPIVPQSGDSVGFGVEIWGFAGGYGIAAKRLSGTAPFLRYSSGGSAADMMFTETAIAPASTNHTLKVIPERQSWFSMFRDPDRANNGVQHAIEERSTATLQRVYRYESMYIDDATPTAFAVDTDNGLLYVAYSGRKAIEVFCLP